MLQARFGILGILGRIPVHRHLGSFFVVVVGRHRDLELWLCIAICGLGLAWVQGRLSGA
jgi:hypothetical protein